MIKNLKKRKKSVVANLIHSIPYARIVRRKGSYAIPAGMVPYKFSIHVTAAHKLNLINDLIILDSP